MTTVPSTISQGRACGSAADESAAPAATTNTEATSGAESADATPTAAVQAATAVATLESKSESHVTGTIRFRQSADGVEVTADLAGLTPNTKHGFHVHETGDCSAADGTSAGGHWNPAGVPHALPPAASRHAGDMGNLTSDADGKVHVTETFHGFELAGPNSVVGRAVIVHAKEDVGSQPSGDAGARVACGVIVAE